MKSENNATGPYDGPMEPCYDEHEQPSAADQLYSNRSDEEEDDDEERQEEILGSDDDEQEDPKDYCKGTEFCRH